MAEYRVTTHKGSNPLVHAVAVCEEKNTWKKDMEDVTVFQEGFGGKEGTSFFGIFDGFHGQNSATIACKELPLLILDQLSKQDHTLSLEEDQAEFLSRFEALFQEDCKPYQGQAPNTALASEHVENLTKMEKLNHVFNTAFFKMDRILGLGRSETSRIRWSGCTALVCLIDTEASSAMRGHVVGHPSGTAHTTNPPVREETVGRILIANCGNIHAVLINKGRGFRLTKDHSTSNPKERKRILRNGGSISVNKQHGLVEGITRATRGLGHYGDRKLRKSVIPVPYVVSLPFDSTFQLLVLASSGLWEVLDAHAVAEMAQTVIEVTQKSSISKAQPLIKISEKSLPIAETHGQSRLEAPIPDEKQLRLNASSARWEGEGKEIMSAGNTQGEGSSPVLPQEGEPSGEENDIHHLRTPPVDYERLAADICRELVDAAVVSGSRENISVMVILLRGMD